MYETLSKKRPSSTVCRPYLMAPTGPKNDAERLVFARLCSYYERRLYATSARLHDEALAATPQLADDHIDEYRYRAARAAAMAGCGQGKDQPPPDDAIKDRWRTKAVDWLKAELRARSTFLETSSPQARLAVVEALRHWKVDPDLAGLRDPAALAKLPADEQKACQALWAEVDALVKNAQGNILPR